MKSRLTVVEQVYHTAVRDGHPDQPTQHASVPFTRELESDEQVWQRTLKVGEAWQPIDQGWLDEAGVGLLLLQNEEGRFTQTKPSPEEKEEAAKKVVEVGASFITGASGMVFAVPAGESARVPNPDMNHLMIRCQHGTARVTVTLFPK